MPRNYSRKNFRVKSLVGNFIGYSEEKEIGYKMFIPDNKEIVVEVNLLFNEIIAEYLEIYYSEIKKLRIEVVKEESTVKSFADKHALRRQ